MHDLISSRDEYCLYKVVNNMIMTLVRSVTSVWSTMYNILFSYLTNRKWQCDYVRKIWTESQSFKSPSLYLVMVLSVSSVIARTKRILFITSMYYSSFWKPNKKSWHPHNWVMRWCEVGDFPPANYLTCFQVLLLCLISLS